MLCLDGQPLLYATGECIRRLERDLDPSRLNVVLNRSWPGIGMLGIANRTDYRSWPPRPLRINRFYWPVGASRWAWGLLVVDTNTMGAIAYDAFGAGDEANPVDLLITHDTPGDANNAPTVFDSVKTSVYPMAPIPVHRVLKADASGESDHGLFLIPVVDKRYFWWNVATPDFAITDTAGVAWTDVILGCGSALKITIAIDDVDSRYLQPSSAIGVQYEAIPPVLDAICWNIGHRFIASLGGSYSTQSFKKSLKTWQDYLRDNPYKVLRAGGPRYLDAY